MTCTASGSVCGPPRMVPAEATSASSPLAERWRWAKAAAIGDRHTLAVHTMRTRNAMP